MTATLRILLFEDSEGNADLVAGQIENAHVAVELQRVDSRDALVHALQAAQPHVVLAHHASPRTDSIAALDVVRSMAPGLPVIVVTGRADTHFAVECVRAGAEDVIGPESLARLPAAITRAMETRERLSRLSPRQRQVLRMVAQGHTTPAIAAQLELSVKTIETHRGELMRRMGIHDVVGLVRYAVRIGIVSADDGLR